MICCELSPTIRVASLGPDRRGHAVGRRLCRRPPHVVGGRASARRSRRSGRSADAPGRFTHSDEMKTSQETILELARSRGVVTKCWPKSDHRPINRPRTGLAMRPSKICKAASRSFHPKSAEFGKTEVFYLKVRDKSQSRALKLAAAVCTQLQTRFAELRAAKAQADRRTDSNRSPGENDLTTATHALADVEGEIGSDLAELRILNESPAGDSDLRRTATDLEKELRGYPCVASRESGVLEAAGSRASRSQSSARRPERVAQVAAGAGPPEGRPGRRSASHRPGAGQHVGRSSDGACRAIGRGSDPSATA